MITVYISIGNSDDKLTQANWSLYVANVRELLLLNASNTHGEWYSLPAAPFQNACFCIELPNTDAADRLKAGLGQWARSFRQDSIAWAEVPVTEFIQAAEAA